MLARKKPFTRPPNLVPKSTGLSSEDKGPARNERHLAFVRSLPCLCCEPGKQTSPTHAHHVRCLLPRTLGKRVSDFLTAPLCQWHHQDAPSALHKGDEASFWLAYGIDIRERVCRLLRSVGYPGAKEALAQLEKATS